MGKTFSALTTSVRQARADDICKISQYFPKKCQHSGMCGDYIRNDREKCIPISTNMPGIGIGFKFEESDGKTFSTLTTRGRLASRRQHFQNVWNDREKCIPISTNMPGIGIGF